MEHSITRSYKIMRKTHFAVICSNVSQVVMFELQIPLHCCYVWGFCWSVAVYCEIFYSDISVYIST